MNKTIWMLWLQGIEKAPSIVRTCYESWVFHNPGWTIKVLEQSDVEALVPEITEVIGDNVDVIIRPSVSDIIRINLLKTYGGVWVDATLFCLKPLDDWLFTKLDKDGFFMFTEPCKDKLASSWFIAAEQESYYIGYFSDVINNYWRNSKFFNIEYPLLNKVVTKLIVTIFSNKRPWISQFIVHPFVHRYLKVYPYFWFHFLLNRLYYSDNKFRMFWNSNASASIPASLCLAVDRVNLKESINEHIELKQLLSDKIIPVLKLNKNISIENVSDGSVLEYILSTLNNA